MSEFEDSLDKAERKVVEAIELAATMSAQLAARAQVAPDGGAAASEAACRRTQEQFLQRVREAKDIMTVQSHPRQQLPPPLPQHLWRPDRRQHQRCEGESRSRHARAIGSDGERGSRRHGYGSRRRMRHDALMQLQR